MSAFKSLTTLLTLALSASAAAVTRTNNNTPAAAGAMTYYNAGLGACGHTNSDTDNIVAVAPSHYGSGDRCGNYIAVTYQGKTVRVEVVDRCTGCGPDDLDVSPAVFTALTGGTEAGRVSVSWDWA